MQNNSMVTVLLTVYNRKSVKKTIESVLSQTYKDFVFLIVDNHSDDGTYELLEEYANGDNRIVLIRNSENKGQTYSLLKGMRMVETEYIARIDADDIMHEDRLKDQVSFMEAHKDYGLCGSWVQFITDEDDLAMRIEACSTDQGARVYQRIGCAFYHPSVLMRREVLEKYNITYNKDRIMAEDYELWDDILQHSKGLNLPKVLTYYRRGNNNDSKHNAATAKKENNIIRRNICSRNDYNQCENLIKNLDIEDKSSKTVFEAVGNWKRYNSYLKSNLMRNNRDYAIIKKAIKIRILDEFIVNNTKMWALLLNKTYVILRSLLYRLYGCRKKKGC